MPAPTTRRSLLPLLHVSEHLTNRSPRTCRYRCGDQCAQPVPNTSANEYFGDMVAAAVSRRSVLQGATGAAVVTSLAWGTAEDAAAAPGRGHGQGRKNLAGFEPIPPTPNHVDDVVVPAGYAWAPVISWGDPSSRGRPTSTSTPSRWRRRRGRPVTTPTTSPSDAGAGAGTAPTGD
ncbi:hypothetical protein [Ornithinimicrobium cerasi]|uniref:hypothetical protein n=1 Tax=Ornithinimicrobium cerasi TaxID=2248773 RepID=UPI001F28FC4A|nr:hypothetical protein [Ornithinimicrobium cerasi]